MLNNISFIKRVYLLIYVLFWFGWECFISVYMFKCLVLVGRMVWEGLGGVVVLK